MPRSFGSSVFVPAREGLYEGLSRQLLLQSSVRRTDAVACSPWDGSEVGIQHLMRTGVVEYAWSKVLDYELGQSPYFDQIDEICDWVDWAAVYVNMDDSIAADGAAIMRYGVKRMDALHLASAKAAGCDWFLTTDRGILKHVDFLDGMRVANPVDFAMEDAL